MRAPNRSGLASAVALLAFVGCAGGQDDRSAEIASVLARADEPHLRTRPRLVAGKYRRMAGDPWAFFRGTLPLYVHDFRVGTVELAASRFELDGPLPHGLGDPHPENFGILLAADATAALEPNDFDAADAVPYLFDLRRLVTGVVLAARLSNADDPAARSAASAAAGTFARAAAASYLATLRALADGAAPERIVGGDGAVVADLFERSARDAASRAELDSLTAVEAGARRLRRGVLDPTEPTEAFADLPAFALAALPETLERYRQSLLAPPAASFFALKDAARHFGSGVASWSRVRAELLLEGPSAAVDDDVIVELKELGDSGLGGWYPPGVVADSPGERVVAASRAAWARPDAEPVWGTSSWLGLACQLRRKSEAHKTVRIDRLRGDRGTPEAIADLATHLGALLARVHGSPRAQGRATARAIVDAVGADGEAFAAEQAAAAERYAGRALDDWALFVDLLRDLGPRLGVPDDPSDAPRADVASLYGTPPEAP